MPPRTVVVFGSTGQVGTELLRQTPPRGWSLTGVTRDEADISERAAVERVLSRYDVGLVVNAAAYTAVDRAESDVERCFAVNRDGPRHVAEACARRNVPLIHISTDYVFDGDKVGAYVETDPVNPKSVYGASKAAGDAAVREILDRHVILRVSWVFAAHGRNFVKTMLALGGQRDELAIVDDQIGAPSAAADIARSISVIWQRLAEQGGEFGTFHHGCVPAVTWFQFAQDIFERAAALGARRPRLRPITSAEYPTAAVRPRNSVLDATKLKQAYGIDAPDWRAGLDRCVRQLWMNGGVGSRGCQDASARVRD